MGRMWNAICSYIEAKAKALNDEDAEPQPEGNNFTQAGIAHAYTSEPELHNGHRQGPVEWEDRTRRIGFYQG